MQRAAAGFRISAHYLNGTEDSFKKNRDRQRRGKSGGGWVVSGGAGTVVVVTEEDRTLLPGKEGLILEMHDHTSPLL